MVEVALFADRIQYCAKVTRGPVLDARFSQHLHAELGDGGDEETLHLLVGFPRIPRYSQGPLTFLASRASRCWQSSFAPGQM
jgi:hypothetical protein